MKIILWGALGKMGNALRDYLVTHPIDEIIAGIDTRCDGTQNVVNDASLLPAVNIGGLGTPIASLASLITLTEFKKRQPEKLGKYIAMFTGLNVLFLVVLYLTQANI